MRAQVITAAAILGCALNVPVRSQSSSTERVTFEVASIKPTNSMGNIWSGGPGRYSVIGITTHNLIRNAFDLYSDEIFGGPAWTESDRFQVNATYSGDPTPAREQLPLLEDRFALKAHRETRVLPKYRAILSRKDGTLGAQLIPSSGKCGRVHPSMPCSMFHTNGEVTFNETELTHFLGFLESVVHRRIVDETGLAGEFDIKLAWSRGPNDSERPSIFTALQEQLGLKLEATQGPVQVLIIDSIQHPSPD